MKLRIQGNSLRLRLAPSEVAKLRETGSVQSFIEFGSSLAMTYSLEASSHVQSVTASFDGRAIRVLAPVETLNEWVQTDRVGMKSSPDAALPILVEKDFRCLHRAAGDLDVYPNPLMP